MEKITVSIKVEVPKAVAWEYFTTPAHITKWNNASPDWHTLRASNDLRVGGRFRSRMEAVDGSQGFDFEGEYTDVMQGEHYTYELSDGRVIAVTFTEENGGTRITEVFDPETENPIEMQQFGWQSILNNFKRYAEKAYQKQQSADTGFFALFPFQSGKDTDFNDSEHVGGDTGGDTSGGDDGGGD